MRNAEDRKMQGQSHLRGPQGVRSDRDSGSKVSNLTPFHPLHSEMYRVYGHHVRILDSDIEKPIIRAMPLHGAFVMPLTEEDVHDALAKVPDPFKEGLKGVFLLSGAQKQIQVFRSLFLFGVYWQRCIFIHPFPRKHLEMIFKQPPQPHVLHEYERAGATVVTARRGVSIHFDLDTLRNFYVRDVFMHELGHHVATHNPKSGKKREDFAKWFATEYGYVVSRRHLAQ